MGNRQGVGSIPPPAYAPAMPAPAPSLLSRLRGQRRGPGGGVAVRTRVAAALVVVGLIVLTAPVVVVPIIRALVHTLI